MEIVLWVTLGEPGQQLWKQDLDKLENSEGTVQECSHTSMYRYSPRKHHSAENRRDKSRHDCSHSGLANGQPSLWFLPHHPFRRSRPGQLHNLGNREDIQDFRRGKYPNSQQK